MPGTGGAMGGKRDVELLSRKLRHPEPRPELGETLERLGRRTGHSQPTLARCGVFPTRIRCFASNLVFTTAVIASSFPAVFCAFIPVVAIERSSCEHLHRPDSQLQGRPGPDFSRVERNRHYGDVSTSPRKRRAGWWSRLFRNSPSALEFPSWKACHSSTNTE